MVLEFMASRPDDRFSLSELARECQLNKATAHALLTELTARGVLLRHPEEKRYSLGPRLVPIGTAAGRGYRIEDFAPAVLKRLAGDTGGSAAALVRARNDDHALVVSQRDVGTQGRRLPPRWPLVPPTGAVFFAWSDDPSVQAWLARCPPGGSVHQAIEGLEAVRRNGVMIGAAVPAWWRLVTLLANPRLFMVPAPGVGPDDEEHQALRETLAELSRSRALITEVDPGTSYEVAYVAAPVFDHTGSVALAVAVASPEDRVVTTGGELLDLAATVVAAADELTEAGFGVRPD